MALQTTDTLRSDVERSRDELARAVEELRTSVSEALDWRRRVRRRPWRAVGGAFAIGLVLGFA